MAIGVSAGPGVSLSLEYSRATDEGYDPTQRTAMDDVYDSGGAFVGSSSFSWRQQPSNRRQPCRQGDGLLSGVSGDVRHQ